MPTRKILPLFMIIVLLASMISACGGGAEPAPSGPTAQASAAPAATTPPEPSNTPEPTATLDPTETPEPTEPPAPADTWTVMLYQDGDDDVLEKDIFMDLNEAEMVGSTDKVAIVSQLDRTEGAYSGGGDWTTTKRFLVQYDESGDMEQLASEELEDLGEVDMSMRETLVDFVTWAIKTYPASKYALILSDHGSGWPGGFSDKDSSGSDNDMDPTTLQFALDDIQTNTGIQQIELLGFDACLMAQLEPLSTLAPYARYTVASEETEPSLGWAYSSFLQAVVDNPLMDGKELAKAIVDSYIIDDGRITDDDARKGLIRDSFSGGGSMSAEQVANEFSDRITLTAIDNAALLELNARVNDLAVALQDIPAESIAAARGHTQAYTSIFGKNTPKSYIDLGHFTKLLMEESDDEAVNQAAEGVQSALEAAVVAEKHGPKVPGSSGLTIYFPNSSLYSETSEEEGWLPYTWQVMRFAGGSLWDDFLKYMYTGQPIDDTTADLSAFQPMSTTTDFTAALEQSAPEENSEIQAPGAGKVEFNSLTTSADTVSLDGSVTLSADIQGNNIAYVYMYTGYYDPDSDSYLTMDVDFVDAGQTKEVDGVAYPDWGDSQDQSFDIDWSPFVTQISDGENQVMAASQAEIYGADTETTTYQVWGTYLPVDSENSYEAFLRFDANGTMITAFAFTGDENDGAPREITFSPGDRFTPEEEWLSFDKNPDGEYEYYDGETLTFGEDGFVMTSDTGFTGSYEIGLIVEDLDGNTFDQYVEVNVE